MQGGTQGHPNWGGLGMHPRANPKVALRAWPQGCPWRRCPRLAPWPCWGPAIVGRPQDHPWGRAKGGLWMVAFGWPPEVALRPTWGHPPKGGLKATSGGWPGGGFGWVAVGPPHCNGPRVAPNGWPWGHPQGWPHGGPRWVALGPTHGLPWGPPPPHRAAPRRAAPHRTAPHRAAPHRTAPHRTW